MKIGQECALARTPARAPKGAPPLVWVARRLDGETAEIRWGVMGQPPEDWQTRTVDARHATALLADRRRKGWRPVKDGQGARR